MKISRLYTLCTLMILLKYIDFPGRFFKPSYSTTDYLFYKPPYILFPQWLFPLLCITADLATAYHISSMDYFYYTLFTPLDISSIENLLLACAPSSLDFLGSFLDPLFIPISKFPYLVDTSKFNHTPSLSSTWYYHMCMFQQFSEYTASLLLITSWSLMCSEPRLFPILKTRSTFKNYLFFIHKSSYLPIYFTLYVVFAYLSYMFYTYSIVNTNFLYWTTLLFNCLYTAELKYKKSSVCSGSC